MNSVSVFCHLSLRKKEKIYLKYQKGNSSPKNLIKDKLLILLLDREGEALPRAGLQEDPRHPGRRDRRTWRQKVVVVVFCCCCLPFNHVVAVGPRLLKKFLAFGNVGCVLRTAWCSII